MKLENLICHKIEVDLLPERLWIVDKVLCRKISISNQALLKLELKIHNNSKILPHLEYQEIIKMIIDWKVFVLKGFLAESIPDLIFVF